MAALIQDVFPYVTVFLLTLVLTLALTPVVRGLHRRWGMVDKPDPRRINRVPIPRGGGLAIVIGVLLPYSVFVLVTGRPFVQGLEDASAFRMLWLAVAMALLGLADDKFSLAPKLKLLGQVAIALLVWGWAGLGFHVLWPSLPPAVDCLLTVCWIIGAVNAFNLIDGLDGLATGLALIAVLGMAGGVFFIHNPQAALFYFAFVGGLLGFLRYNWHPASVFLGDCGSMFIGFVVCTLPLASQVPKSFMVSVGVPLLAMGVPIFDTALAILRRLIRRLLHRGDQSGQVMSADADHLHHRILRATGLNQRKTAMILYAMALTAVVIGIAATALQSRATGLWLAAMAIASVVIFQDAKIEMFDAGKLLFEVAHSRDHVSRRRMALLSVPFFLFLDLALLVGVFSFCSWALKLRVDMPVIRGMMLVRVVSVFGCLVFFRVYRTVWSRALGSNYVRLLLACVFGSVIGSVIIYYWPSFLVDELKAMTVAYASVSFMALFFVRVLRSLVRDLFYALDCRRLRDRQEVSRILVYGAGLRYRAFRRELIRTTAANDRMIVGILDDDIYLHGRYIGGIKVLGSIGQAQVFIRKLGVDAVVIACDISDEWLRVVKGHLEPTGVKVTRFRLTETAV